MSASTIRFLRNYFDASDLTLISDAVERYQMTGSGKGFNQQCRKLAQIFREAGNGTQI